MEPGLDDDVATAGVWRLLAEHRSGVQMLLDGLAWAVALPCATLARFEFAADRINVPGLVIIVAVAAAGTPRLVPLGAVLGGGLGAFVGMGATRYVWRLYVERTLRPDARRATKLVVFGAGEGAEQVITAMLRNPESPYLPCALLDDDPARRHLQIRGVPVVGTRAAIADVARRYEAEALLIAIPSASGELVREISELAHAADLEVKVLPPVSELLDGTIGVSDIRPLSDADLLGRHEVTTDLKAIAGYLTGRRVLVTGAGGSIGSELCRQLQRFALAELIMLDRDESALHGVQLSLNGQAALDSSDVVLADIRDRDRIEAVFAERRPDVVFHAAALKHVTALQRHPCEAVKTNVWGTMHVLEAAASSGVERFVNVSTDKAANPHNVLGYTKLLAERLTAYTARETSGTYLSVRFGNVLGSRGSVLTVFRSQIAAGGPVTVTDPDVTRYFMTVEEAVQLVIQAGAIGRDGETLVLDMGEPVRIADVAARLVEQADRPIAITYTGLRPGEKLHECLFADAEADHRPVHPLISHVTGEVLDPLTLIDLDLTAPDLLRARLHTLGNGKPGVAGGSTH